MACDYGCSMYLTCHDILKGKLPPCASNIMVATPSASDNSRYVTALDVVREFVTESAPNEARMLVDWLYKRLNAEKDPHCT